MNSHLRDNINSKKEDPLDPKFDFVNWFYWAIWWQQCSYYPTPYNLVGNSSTLNQPHTPPRNVPGIGIHIRVITGYETAIAPLWRRLVAELIDVCLFGLLLKLYIPDFEYRVPEIIFESNDVWKEIDEEELLEIRRLIIHFLVSTVVQRLAHAVCEMVFLWMFGWTPGKWLLGLRVMKCTTSHLTRTIPGFSVRVEPGGKITFIQAALRSLFKASVSAFIPLIVFFFNTFHGRTRYDKLFNCIVVDVASLHRPLFVSGPGLNQFVNINLNEQGQGPQVHVQIR